MMIRKVLLFCGILSSLLYVATDILGAIRFGGYSYTSQTISELSAIGAPSRPLVIPLFIAHSALRIAFGLGVWRSANGKRALHVVGGLLIGYGAINLVAPFTPMHLRRAESTLTDTLHITLTIVTVLFILLTIGFGATAFGKQFRLYSIGTILVLIVFGALAGLDGPRIAANEPTPWVGVTERINIFGYLLWVMVLAVALLASRWHGHRPVQQEM